jgi:hypothetical protein
MNSSDNNASAGVSDNNNASAGVSTNNNASAGVSTNNNAPPGVSTWVSASTIAEYELLESTKPGYKEFVKNAGCTPREFTTHLLGAFLGNPRIKTRVRDSKEEWVFQYYKLSLSLNTPATMKPDCSISAVISKVDNISKKALLHGVVTTKDKATFLRCTALSVNAIKYFLNGGVFFLDIANGHTIGRHEMAFRLNQARDEYKQGGFVGDFVPDICKGTYCIWHRDDESEVKCFMPDCVDGEWSRLL